MGILYDDVVILRQSEKEDEPSVITVNCPDKTGLGCDLCRIILFFGLVVVRVGMCICIMRAKISLCLVFIIRATRAIALCYIKNVNFCLLLVYFGVFLSGWVM